MDDSVLTRLLGESGLAVDIPALDALLRGTPDDALPPRAFVSDQLTHYDLRQLLRRLCRGDHALADDLAHFTMESRVVDDTFFLTHPSAQALNLYEDDVERLLARRAAITQAASSL